MLQFSTLQCYWSAYNNHNFTLGRMGKADLPIRMLKGSVFYFYLEQFH